jgi:hypothetical protein
MRFRKRILVTAAALVAFAGLALSSPAAHASTPSICGNGGTGYCLNAWGGGGTDLPVKMYNGGVANDAYNFQQIVFMCHDGHVHAAAPYGPCPFNNSSLDSQMNGAVIFEIASGRDGLCVGSTSSTVGSTEEACPDSFGNFGGWGTIYAQAGNSSCQSPKFFAESRYWSDAYGGLSSLASGGNVGKQAFTSPNTSGATCWGWVNT